MLEKLFNQGFYLGMELSYTNTASERINPNMTSQETIILLLGAVRGMASVHYPNLPQRIPGSSYYEILRSVESKVFLTRLTARNIPISELQKALVENYQGKTIGDYFTQKNISNSPSTAELSLCELGKKMNLSLLEILQKIGIKKIIKREMYYKYAKYKISL